MKILGIAGSLRAGSFNRQLLQLAASHLPDGVELAVWRGSATCRRSTRTQRARRRSPSRPSALPSRTRTRS